MSEVIGIFVSKTPDICLTNRCEKDGCKVILDKALTELVVVDMDCVYLPIPEDTKRCDDLCIGYDRNTTWVIPIELKSGGFSANSVLKQLEIGVRYADRNLPTGIPIQLSPILAHGKGVHRHALKLLRSRKLRMRGQYMGTKLIRCGDALSKGLEL